MKNTRSGLTLIEVLIAISLLSLLSVGMLVALRIGLNTMEKTDAHLVQNRKVANVRQIIENELAGFTFTRAHFHPNPQQTIPVSFTQFEPNSMRFVTSYSLQDAWRGRAQIAALQVIPGEDNRGVRLIVNETPYTGPEQAGLMVEGLEPDPALGLITHYAPIVPGPGSFVLADKLAYCRFTYLQTVFQPGYPQPLRLWLPQSFRPALPFGVRIEMAPLESGAGELHMSTVTVSFPVNRTADIGYSDVE